MNITEINDAFKIFLTENSLNLLVNCDHVGSDALTLANTFYLESIKISRDTATLENGDIFFGRFEMTVNLNGVSGNLFTAEKRLFNTELGMFRCFSNYDYLSFTDGSCTDSFFFEDTEPEEFASEFKTNYKTLQGFLEILYNFGILNYLQLIYEQSLRQVIEKRVEYYQNLMGEDTKVSYFLQHKEVPYIVFNGPSHSDTFRFDDTFYDFKMDNTSEIKIEKESLNGNKYALHPFGFKKIEEDINLPF